MQTFELYIDDDRYTVTTLRFLLLRDARRAREKAESAMSESAHHRGVEVYRGGARLFGLGSLETAARELRSQ